MALASGRMDCHNQFVGEIDVVFSLSVVCLIWIDGVFDPRKKNEMGTKCCAICSHCVFRVS